MKFRLALVGLVCCGIAGVSILLLYTKPRIRTSIEPTPERRPSEETNPSSRVSRMTADGATEDAPAPVDYRARFFATERGIDRVLLLKRIPKEDLERVQDFLFELVDADHPSGIRSEAIRQLARLAWEPPARPSISQRLCSRILIEKEPVVRWHIIEAISYSYVRHPDSHPFCFNVVLDRLRNDSDPDVRKQAVSCVNCFVGRDEGLPLLRSALESERNTEVLEEIHRKIRDYEESDR